MTRPSPVRPIRFHRFALSGHCHRVEWLLHLLELPVEVRHVDLRGGEQRSAAFLALNPFGQVPVIEDGATVVADSNAILVYLASEYGAARWLPASSTERADLQRWLSVAAGPLASGPAAARAQHLFGRPGDVAPVRQRAHALLATMDAHLARRPFLLGSELGLADIANYAYTAHAPEGGVPLDEYPSVRAWIARIRNTPRFVPMAASPGPAS
jgi:glutathione S-transferase